MQGGVGGNKQRTSGHAYKIRRRSQNKSHLRGAAKTNLAELRSKGGNGFSSKLLRQSQFNSIDPQLPRRPIFPSLSIPFHPFFPCHILIYLNSPPLFPLLPSILSSLHMAPFIPQRLLGYLLPGKASQFNPRRHHELLRGYVMCTLLYHVNLCLALIQNKISISKVRKILIVHL